VKNYKLEKQKAQLEAKIQRYELSGVTGAGPTAPTNLSQTTPPELKYFQTPTANKNSGIARYQSPPEMDDFTLTVASNLSVIEVRLLYAENGLAVYDADYYC